MEHGAVAGRNAVGGSNIYESTPSFWTEQYDLYVQGVGWPDAAAHKVSRQLQGKRSLMMEVKNGILNHAIGINAQRDLAIVRRLIERKVPVDLASLADPALPFDTILKANAKLSS